MINPTLSSLDERVLVLAPTEPDAAVFGAALAQAGLPAENCADAQELCQKIEAGAGAVVIDEEALTAEALPGLTAVLQKQNPWSEIPIVVFTRGEEPGQESAPSISALEAVGNVTRLERPIRVRTLVSVLRSALRARRRQYEVRDLFLQMERAVRQRDEFLAMLGHELRNPLGTIRNAVYVLDRISPHDKPAAVEQRAIITRQTGHLARLVDDLLDVARVTSGKIPLQRQLVDLSEVAQRSLQAMMAGIREQQHEVTFSPPQEPLLVEGDPVRLDQVFTNLLANAIKYTPPRGHIYVTLAREGNEAVARVRDTGIGIAAEMLPYIFELFTQADRSLDRARGGLGIGLTLVQKLVQMQGGGVTASSPGPGQGSEFVVRLPLAARTTIPAEGKSEPAATAARHILLVEDNPDARDVLQTMLRLEGHQVEAVDSGQQGVDKALATRPDIGLIDIGLPGMDGYQVARQIRVALGSSIFLIALTGYGQPTDRKQAQNAGFDTVLVKPVEPEQLSRVLAEAHKRSLLHADEHRSE